MNALEARNVSKVFPGVRALDCVDFTAESGKIHCIIGENGAGKSTLIKCLTGVYVPEYGTILINEEDASQNASLFKRVAYVPQEIGLFNYLTVAENLFIPYDRSGINGAIDQKKLNKLAQPILNKFQLKVDPSSYVKDISVSEQQLLQVARAVSNKDFDVLLLDEPTTSLTISDTEILFDIIREIKTEGKAIIYISHKIEELWELGDEVTVLRNGKKVAHSNLDEIDTDWIISHMTGQMIDQNKVYFPEKISDEVLLDVQNLYGERFRDISFQVKRGEILGFCGLVGAGRSELMQAIFGYLPIYSGTVIFNGVELKQGDTHESVKKGLLYLPEDRKSQGILPVMTVRENITISVLDQLKSLLFVSKRIDIELAEEMIDRYDIRTSSIEQQIQFLSGGNQQKAIISRAMCTTPQLLIFDEPTKGIDVGTKAMIYQIMKDLVDLTNISIILISSEMDEVLRCANRVVTLYEGRKIKEFGKQAKKEDVLTAMLGLAG